LSTAQQQLPWIGSVPVLGALFSSKDYQKNETDLVIIVTPRIVRPTRPGDVVKTPLDGTLPANDVDFFLNNKPEVLRTEVRATEEEFGRPPFAGHMIDLPQVELRPPGPAAAVRVLGAPRWSPPRVADAPKRQPPSPNAPAKIEAQVLDVPKTPSAADRSNGQPQVLDLPKGESNAAL
jgi:hypothetical protein